MRRLLSLCLAAAGAAGLLAAPAGARVRHAADFSARVTLPAAASAATTTRALRAPRRFDLVGFRWRGRIDPGIRVRVRRDGGRWSRWVRAAAAAGHGARHGSDPVWAGGSDAYQLRLARRVAGLRAHFVRVPRFAARGARAAAAGDEPAIRPRSAWDPNGDCAPRHPPTYGSVRMAFVHHTVSANSYGPADSAAMVLAICRYHENGNGWWDIGYNFLVDRYGTIFEGRAGGTAQAVIGAQAQGFNSVSTGIASLGDFSAGGQTRAGLGALARLVGWKLALHGVPATGRVTVTSAGGASNRYPSGTRVTFERISGHRDGDLTECPGDGLYAQLPELRRRATAAWERYANRPRLTLAATPAALSFPAPATLAGTLVLPDGPGVADRPVVLERLEAGGWVPWRTVTTGADGTWSTLGRLRNSAQLRASWAGEDPQGPLASPAVRVSVRPTLALWTTRSVVPRGGRVTVRGLVRPRKARVTVLLQRVIRGRWRTTQRWPRLRTRSSRFAVRPVLEHRARYRVLARTPADRWHAAGRSAPVALAVRP